MALVTGGTGDIGLAVANKLLAEGAQVVLADLVLDRSAQIQEELGSGCHVVQLDVTKASQVNSVVNDILSRFGRLDLLAHCAGTVSYSPLTQLTEEDWDSVVDVNLKGTFLVNQAVARLMMPSGRGAMVNIASSLALSPRVETAHYCASKAGALVLTKALALELAPRGIRVNAVAPGTIRTKLAVKDRGPEALVEGAKRIPLGKVGEPVDIANAVSFLLSDDARHITGETLFVNGGSLMH